MDNPSTDFLVAKSVWGSEEHAANMKSSESYLHFSYDLRHTLSPSLLEDWLSFVIVLIQFKVSEYQIDKYIHKNLANFPPLSLERQ